jgi:hypothetical protein
MGVVLHQNGLLPLHANSVVVGGNAFAFCGHSGAGKSTLAAWFHDRGFDILADDVCVVGFDEAAGPMAHPGIPRMRLWREALEASGRIADDYPRSFEGMEKYDVPTRSNNEGSRPLPLKAVYLLRRLPEGAAAPQFRRLAGVEALDALVSNTYRGAYLQTIKRTGEHLQACLKLVKAVPVFSVERLWDLQRFDEQAALLETHCWEQ